MVEIINPITKKPVTVRVAKLNDGIAGRTKDSTLDDLTVYVDPSVPEAMFRSLVVHEYVELKYILKGDDYSTAHENATKAEKTCATKHGANWESYNRNYLKLLNFVEKREPLPANPADLYEHIEKGADITDIVVPGGPAGPRHVIEVVTSCTTSDGKPTNCGSSVQMSASLDECVSRKVKILMDEGKDQKQALAIAYSMCGEAKKAFTDPFPEGISGPLEGSALVRALQLDIAAEHDATALYTAHADKALDARVKDTLESIAREELVHVGELEALIDYITSGNYSQAVSEGVAEANGVQKSFMSRIQKTDEKLRLVSGVVLEPDSIDLQGDQIEAEDIRKAMESYMINSRVIGHQHHGQARAAVVECYIAPVDFRLADKELVRKGSWMMTVKVFDDSIWKSVTDGTIKGFSIGGRGVRTPIK